MNRCCKSSLDWAPCPRRQSCMWLSKLQQKQLLCRRGLLLPTAGSLMLRTVSQHQRRTPMPQERRTPNMLTTCVLMQQRHKR